MTISFEDRLTGALREVANPEPRAGMAGRIAARMQGERVAVRLMLPSEENVLISLWRSVRELLLPRRLPELVLESRPIAVADALRTERSPGAVWGAVAAHVAVILLMGLLLREKLGMVSRPKSAQIVALDAPPPRVLPRAVAMGGGGGQRGPTPVTKGTPPKFAERQIVAPKVPPPVEAKIPMLPTIEVQKDLKMASSLPQIGVANSPLVGMSMGNGLGTGLGGGYGSGLGSGSGGNMGGGPRRIGGGVSAPTLTHEVMPDYSEEARKAKYTGTVVVNIWVDTNGNPTHVRVLRGLGMGLDEKAIEAVKQYRFRPGMENGKAVLTEVNIEIQFQIL